MTRFAVTTALMIMFAIGLSACDGAKPPVLMKAVKQFDTDATRDEHVNYMRKNHMDVLLHKRDQTLINGIRTKKGSLKACISCHVPEQHNGEVLRHTNPEHFCSTCHGYVAQELDCFQCHADHPASGNNTAKAPDDSVHNNVLALNSNESEILEVNSVRPEVTESNTALTNVVKMKESTSE